MYFKIKLSTIALFIFAINATAQEVSTYNDLQDGKQYKTVKIGTQLWLAENLAFKSNAGCYAYANNEDNVKTFGYLYTWETAKKVCPSGWHLPSQDEWTSLSNSLGGKSSAANKLKESGTAHWKEPVSKATNESGFTALPGGFRNENGEYWMLGYNGWWWCSTENDSERAHNILIYGHTSDLILSYINKICGFSVRCIKD
jgi:uncharacterized protein (TIGR02145 family)